MASVEPTNSIDVVDGVNPDSVAPSVRRSPISPLRIRAATVPPDYSENGVDVTLHGDDDLDTVALTVYSGIPNDRRNGLKRSYTEEGRPALWAEPSPQSYDSAGASVGVLGTPTAPAGAAATEHSLGVAATHTVTNNGDFPLVARPVLTVVGARFESALATLQAVITTTVDAGTPTEVVRDLFYGYGGSNTIKLPARTIAVGGGSLQIDVDLQLTYRQEVTEAFELAVAGAQVIFEIIEYTSAGS